MSVVIGPPQKTDYHYSVDRNQSMVSMPSTKDEWLSLRGMFWVIIICVIVYVIGYSLTWCFKTPHEAGDTAGLVNGLFSALAFAGVIYAIFLQKHELELQRQELSDTRAEMVAQREEFKTQNETLKRQRFENTLFNMLQLQQQITDNISYSYDRKVPNEHYKESEGSPLHKVERVTVNGREVFFVAFEITPHKLHEEVFVAGMRELLENVGLRGYEGNNTPTYFDHYFRHLYRIFKFIEESELIVDDDRQDYASMVRATLSRYELIWLYYNGLSSFGRDKFKPIIERFCLLNNLREDMLANVDLGVTYAREAFHRW